MRGHSRDCVHIHARALFGVLGHQCLLCFLSSCERFVDEATVSLIQCLSIRRTDTRHDPMMVMVVVVVSDITLTVEGNSLRCLLQFISVFDVVLGALTRIGVLFVKLQS